LALGLLFRQVEARALPGVLADVGLGTLALAFAAYLASQVVSALRWRLIAARAGFDLSPRLAVRYYFIGMFFTTLGPSTLGSDVVRTLYLKARGGSPVTAASTVLLDRVIGFVYLVVIAALALACAGWPELPRPLWWGTQFFAVALVLAAFVAVVLGRRGSVTRDGGLAQSIASLCRDRALLLEASALSVVVQTLQVGVAIVLASALTPSVPWGACFVFQPLVAMLAALPISAAGLGIRESGYVYFLTTLGDVSPERAAGFALAWLVVLIAASLSGGVVFLASGELSPRRALRRSAHSNGAQFPSSS